MNLIEQAENFVSKLLKDKLSNSYTYHNFNHTFDVVAAVNTLAESENISASDKEILLISGWFHDTGYIKGCTNHEDSSIVIASDFLMENGKSTDYIEKVAELIKATKKEYVPQTLSEKIIKDADYYHILNDDYIFSCERLRNEWENIEGKSFTDKDWAVENLNFLANIHRFYTDYALENYRQLLINGIFSQELVPENINP